MIMNDFMIIILCLAIGAGLGIFYFGGLWLTLKKLPSSGNPYFLTLGSFFGRTVLSLFGFYLVARGGQWERLLISLFGFILMKLFMMWRLGPDKKAIPEVKRFW